MLPKRINVNNDHFDESNVLLESGSMRVSIFVIASGVNGARDVSEVMLSNASHIPVGQSDQLISSHLQEHA